MKKLCLLLCVFLLGCRGPTPQVKNLKILPDRIDPSRQWVEVTVENTDGGEGEATLLVRLHNPATDVTLQKSVKIELQPKERLVERLHFPFLPGKFVPEATVKYPPE
jgi:hypothetical protein